MYTVAMQKDTYIDAQINSPAVQEAAPVGINEEGLFSTKQAAAGKYRLEPWLLCIAMGLAILFLDAVLPLDGLWFHTAMLGQPGSWPLLPTHLLFPGWAISSSIMQSYNPAAPDVTLSWTQVPLLLLAFLLVFLLYLLSLRRLPRFTNTSTFRSILYSTALLGLMYVLIPVVTSPDIFSYLSYARMGIIYHLNPLTTLPTAIPADPTYVHIYWNTQPSAYGPTWVALSSALQWLTLIFGSQALLPMIVALRLLGLAAHLCSTLLIWSIVGRIQRTQGQISPAKRTFATLAFAWNPLLLFEACVNAHNDAVLLLLILLAVWFLVPGKQANPGSSLLPAMVVLALATCLKVNVVVLMPFVLIFVRKQIKGPEALRITSLLALVYTGTIILLYAPFWQSGALLNIFYTNPTTSRDINTLVEFFSRLYNSLISVLGYPPPPLFGSASESFTHTLSIGIFVVIYIYLCWRAIRRPEALNKLPSLLRWLAGAWFLYCLIGTPWFWPWYMVTFFGFYAILAGTSLEKEGRPDFSRLSLAIALLTFSMLSIYCFYAWGPHDSFIPGLPDFQWAYLRGPWAWLIPLLALWRFPLRKAKD